MVTLKEKETKGNGQAIGQVYQLSYLGSILTSDARRIIVAKKTFKDLANLLTERSSWIQEKEFVNLMNGQFIYIVVHLYEEEIKIFRITVFQAYAKCIMVR